jgi:DNA-directed RNA polymerase sigma subunit (sigma70/sigma32)
LPQEGVDEDKTLDLTPDRENPGNERRTALDALLGELDPVSAEVVRLRDGLGIEGKATPWSHIANRLGIRMKDAQIRYTEAVAYMRYEAELALAS